MTECPCQRFVISLLYIVCYRLFIRMLLIGLFCYISHTTCRLRYIYVLVFCHFTLLDERGFPNRQHHNCQYQRHEQVDGQCPWHVECHVVHQSRSDEDNREEDGTQTDGSQCHRHEILFYRLAGSMPSAHTLVQEFQITVEYYDGIVHHHTQYYDKPCQCNGIERNSAQIHHTYRAEGGKRNDSSGYQCRTPWEEDEHHQDDDNHRLEQVFQEVLHRAIHDLALVSDALDGNIIG